MVQNLCDKLRDAPGGGSDGMRMEREPWEGGNGRAGGHVKDVCLCPESSLPRSQCLNSRCGFAT